MPATIAADANNATLNLFILSAPELMAIPARFYLCTRAGVRCRSR